MSEDSKSPQPNIELDVFEKTELLVNFQKPNIQFIHQPTQLNRHSFELVKVFESFRDSLKMNDVRSISSRTGIGFLVNTENLNITNFTRDNFVEIVDFDPVRNNLMVIGNGPPVSDATIHWFIYRAYPKINGIIFIDNNQILEHFRTSSFPELLLKDEILDVRLALEILEILKKSEIILMNGNHVRGILIVGKTVMNAYERFNRSYEQYLRSIKQDEEDKAINTSNQGGLL